jgi:hypothetical protein
MRLLVQEHRGLGAAGDSNHKMGFLLPMNLLHLFEQNNEQNKRVQDKKVERERGGIGAPSCTRLFPKDPAESRLQAGAPTFLTCTICTPPAMTALNIGRNFNYHG